jgi:hypothetical protein
VVEVGPAVRNSAIVENDAVVAHGPTQERADPLLALGTHGPRLGRVFRAREERHDGSEPAEPLAAPILVALAEPLVAGPRGGAWSSECDVVRWVLRVRHRPRLLSFAS